ncbi:Holliday junction resolvase RuvX [Candidatus Endomicrobiellum devescovinae]|jgi:putative Holliday junction resolvase|uniref:Holliday junction resolvase RuvX n=1 Tax=Candidatus Endomicrobiellum devescovinae TaxID=3242322 RepID=UPI00283A7AA0|nr:Holliday junction resolvase RuvX [Endomicrobium sp.]MDR1433669.1 Holliday junction resolvase RuvX [Endomicrobium sp.]MDR2818079.1 Holliday junction resolvase RuvX [Endomicrobium sp.]
MSRAMGVDYGLKRIGLAMTDLLRITASPFDTIESISIKKNAAKILEIAKANNVSVIVFGLPVNMNGTEGEMSETVRKAVDEIKTLSSDVEVTTIDERLTTAQAERILIEEADVSREKRKGLKDKIAAALILQTYLDMH